MYVKRLLASIADQTYRDFDIIITDNSPDDSIEMAAALYHDRLPISYYRNDPPTGMAVNFNAGLNKATGTWIKPQRHIPRIILKQTPWSACLMKRCFHTIKQQ